MGTEIQLEIGGLSIDWSKNARGADHGALFQEIDRKPLRSAQLNYDDLAQSHDDAGPREMAFARVLKDVVPRLELLGFTLETAKSEYLAVVEEEREQRDALNDDEPESPPDLMSFDEFCAFAAAHPIQSLDDTYPGSADDGSEDRLRGRFADQSMACRIPGFSLSDQQAYSERSYFGSLVDIIHPYSLLRVFACNAENLSLDVVWQYGPLVENGWATASEFSPGARRAQTFLLATEGSSDAHILRHAFSLLRPDVSDFFRFIDVSEGHPFPGTGNLLKFANGLARIDVQNQVVFIFDNDAEGYGAYQQLSAISLPLNMRAMTLPELEVFRAFPTKGPEGTHAANINRRAAAIECYLDLRLRGYSPAQVVWTNYKSEWNTYHGSLEYKESYTKAFLKQTADAFEAGTYDVSRIRAVLDAVIAECTGIATNAKSSR